MDGDIILQIRSVDDAEFKCVSRDAKNPEWVHAYIGDTLLGAEALSVIHEKFRNFLNTNKGELENFCNFSENHGSINGSIQGESIVIEFYDEHAKLICKERFRFNQFKELMVL